MFNAALFEGRSVLRPEELVEMDTDVSSLLKTGEYAETVQKILDVVKKSARGVDFVILGLENQQHVHYGMPLRILLGDAFGYLKEYQETARKNKKEGRWDSKEEFLSGFRREDRLHPMVTICIYYGEDAWDGPRKLTDMLKIPEELRDVVNDYPMNLIQVRDSGHLRFQVPDVQTVFEVCRNIYRRDYEKLSEVYGDKEIDAELGVVIGTITESQGIVSQALESRGGRMNMCTALEELERKGMEKGMKTGKILARYEDGMSPEEIARKMGLTVEQVEKILEENGMLTMV
ncbi:MAG TPA: sigma-70 family RNA polymerase sigma factor [Candidatus Pullilachnospira stercoravium]|uniref:Sigma-70 family RNA polymerase sigma factor n=1 Tax=Candidatus Pullilachnospira stercoravium TaxID=2840913 RepID=A0A9D1NVM2_9FIRM|nr:sigma-70 family RNA polymerase sigma factor [Candidatus Pullilachnospira stercoravium]